MKFSKHLKIILTEMCQKVGVEFKDVNFNDADWYQKHTWTEEEQDDFVKWMTDYLYTNTEARREITTVISRNKRQSKRAAEMFCFSYGWSFNEKEKKSSS